MEINTNLGVLPVTAQKQQPATAQANMFGRTGRQEDSVARAAEGQQAQQTPVERSKEELEDIVEQIQDAVKVMQRNLNFSVHDTTGTTVVKVMDAGSGEVIRQMPTEDALKLAERLDEMRSLLFEARA